MGCTTVITDCIRVGARVPYTIDLSLFCASVWRARAVYPAAARVRATRLGGFEYEAQVGGQTASREPRWPKSDAAVQTDGGVTWISRPISNQSLQKVITSVTWEAPAEVTVSGESQVTSNGEQSVTAYLEPAAPGDYTVIAWVTFSDSPNHVEGFAIEIEVR